MIERLYDEYIRRLIQVNDETKTEHEHNILKSEFYGWKAGVKDAAGYTFNGDYYYLEKIDNGEMEERPLCCGEFLDWESKVEKKK